MTIESVIRDKIERQFRPTFYEVENESHKHKVPLGSETHFRILVVSDYFKDLSRVDRARKIHELLSLELAGGVHALSQRSFTPAEWAALSDSQKIMISPKCLG